MIHENLQNFWGLSVKDWDAESPAVNGTEKTAYRIRVDYDEYENDVRVATLVEEYASRPGAEKTKALVIGAWDFEMDEVASSAIVSALVNAKGALPQLEALFFGDIIGEEQEVSWIQQTDVTPLLDAYPKLRCLRVRGGTGLVFRKTKHEHLQQLAFESGGLPRAVIEGALASDFPALRHLEFWFGDENYGYEPGVEVLEPLARGALFPALVYLGLRNCEEQDAVAKLFAPSPILDRIAVLDLSLGTLTDQGAQALVAGGKLGKLETLDIHHHFVSEEWVAKLAAATPTLVAHDAQQAEQDGDDVWRFVAVSE